MGKGEMFRRALDILVMRASGDKAKTACGNLQLCAGLEAGIERATRAIGQRRIDKVRARQNGEEEAGDSEEEEENEGGSGLSQ